MKAALRPLHVLAHASALSAVLVACGGGGGGGNPNPPPDPNALQTLSGTVAVDGPVSRAVVCLDLNANGACDTGEPASARTGTDGAYSLQATAQQRASAALISPMVPGALADPATTIDTADGGATAESPYLLRQAPGQAGQINPLTTLVAAGVRSGMALAVARTNAAAQLGISEVKIDNYQDDPPMGDHPIDSARTAASFVAGALEDGVPLEVGDQNAAVAATSYDLRNLRYTDAANFSYQSFNIAAKAAGSPLTSLIDIRAGQTAGVSINPADLYNQAYLTQTGWLRCDNTVPVTATAGTPSRSSFCRAQTALTYRAVNSVAGRAMADVVTEQQADPLNIINTGGLSTAGLLAALGAETFPAGSALKPGLQLTLTQPIFINSINTDGLSQVVAPTLAQMITARPAAAVDLATGAGSLNLGLSSGPLNNLRVAFTGSSSPTAGTVQYYDCDLNAAQTVVSNCLATQTGSYTITDLHGARVMRFAGFAPTVMDNLRVYAEVNASNQANGVIGGGDWVFQARERKPGFDANLSESWRLNATGWRAMQARLALP